MKKVKELPSWERLNEVLTYDPTSPSGLRWKVKVNSRAPAGAAAGCLNKLTGYYTVNVDREAYLAHRVVFAMRNPGVDFQNLQIDHINGLRGDNRIENLRVATVAQNAHNGRLHSNNTSGVKGVYMHRRTGLWHVQICVKQSLVFGGCFKKLEEAKAAAMSLRERLHGEFVNHGERHV